MSSIPLPFADQISVFIPDNFDHIDSYSIKGKSTLSEFIARGLTFRPFWIKGLFRIRGWVAWLLHLKHDDRKILKELRPEDISFQSGEYLLFFQVVAGIPDRYWIGLADDSHLSAWLIFTRDAVDHGGNATFATTTIVKYKNHTGRFYFFLIHPFHRLLVHHLTRKAVSI